MQMNQTQDSQPKTSRRSQIIKPFLKTLFLICGFTILTPLTTTNDSEKVAAAQLSIVPPPPNARADRFGIYNWNINDEAFPNDGSTDRLNWGADLVAQMGSRTIRVALTVGDIYKIGIPETANLKAVAQLPAYDKLFRDPRFKTIMLTTYSRGASVSNWADGFTQDEYETERDEIKKLGEYLLGNPAFADKTFIIFNWEGDNAMHGWANKRSAWDYFTNWIRARAEGVKLARQNVPDSKAQLFSGLEFTLINSYYTRQPCGSPVADPIRQDSLINRCVIDFVAPQVEVDYYSYSSWGSLSFKLDRPEASLKERLKNDLEFALARVRTKRPEVSERNFILGEYSFERALYGECYAANFVNEIFDAFESPDAFQPSYVIYWQVADNARSIGLPDERFGLFRVRDRALTIALPGKTFQKRIAGETAENYTGCPRIRRPPPMPGVLNQEGTPDIRLNPDSNISIYVPNCCQKTDSPFSPSGNVVHFDQNTQRFAISRDNSNLWYESETQIKFSMPPARRPGKTWVYVTDARGVDSNAEIISLNCIDCPRIKDKCGVLNTEYRTVRFEAGQAVSIFGELFSTSGNTVVIEQRDSQQNVRSIVVPRENMMFESTTQLDVRLPENLTLGLQTNLYVVNAQGRGSSEAAISLSKPCQDCQPRMNPCQGIVNELGGDFFAGTVTSLLGQFAHSGNKVILEQVDQRYQVYQYTMTNDSPGWSEHEKRIRFTLPSVLFPGRALIYVIDSQGRETPAQEIFISPTPVTTVNAASYIGPALAVESISAAFGNAMATLSQGATSKPLPTELSGTKLIIKDSAGVERLAPLFFISPAQINFQVPEGSAYGTATLTVLSGFGSSSFGPMQIVRTAPGLFGANANGKGVAAAVALRVKTDNRQIFERVADFDPMRNEFIEVPIDLGPPDEKVFIVLYGTGFRARGSLSAVTVTIGGVNAEVIYAGPQGELIGLDQINVLAPRSLEGRGSVDIVTSVEGQLSNVVKVRFK